MLTYYSFLFLVHQLYNFRIKFNYLMQNKILKGAVSRDDQLNRSDCNKTLSFYYSLDLWIFLNVSL